MSLKSINELSAQQAKDAFLKCCGCESWASTMADSRPFPSFVFMCNHAERLFLAFSREQWLEAFGAHPKIGDIDSLKKKYGSTKEWASNEQSGVSNSDEEVIAGLARGNILYEEKFGYIFIVCATGKSAAEMLALLESRLPNAPDDELTIAANEQKKITYLRLERLTHG
jgi:2-oxo-4-hydroxy-4-carboxy-5-ureidoimidazoline decarboxylase